MGSTIGAIFSSILTTIVVSRIHMHKFDDVLQKMVKEKHVHCVYFFLSYMPG